MNFVVIEGSVKNTKKQLESDKRLMEKVFKDTGKEEYKSKGILIAGKLKALKKHESLQSKRSAFEKICMLKYSNPALYVKKCKDLCKGISGTSFDDKRGTFVVRPSINKKRIYIGSFDHLDDAIEAEEMYMSNLNQFE